VTRWVCEKVAQNVAQPIFVTLNAYIFTLDKSSPNILAIFCDFCKSTQSKQSPVGPKFAQSGHPGLRVKSSRRKFQTKFDIFGRLNFLDQKTFLNGCVHVAFNYQNDSVVKQQTADKCPQRWIVPTFVGDSSVWNVSLVCFNECKTLQ
jgi:hypothetical protein